MLTYRRLTQTTGLMMMLIALTGCSFSAPYKEYNSAYIQKRIDALPPSGGAVDLPGKIFLIDKPIILKSNVKLRGCGASTVLTLQNGLAGPMFSNADWKHGNQNIQMSDMVLTGNADKVKLSDNNYHKRAYAKRLEQVDHVAVYLKNCINISVKRLTFKEFHNEAMMLVRCRAVIVSDNHFLDCSRLGKCNDWAQGAVYLRYSQHCVITHNTIKDCFEGGIVVGFRSDSNLVAGNNVYNSQSGEGVFIGCGSGNTVTDNIVSETSTKGLGSGAGIALSVPPGLDKNKYPAKNNIVFNNTVEHTGGSGISVYKSDFNIISCNTIRDVNLNKLPGRGGISVYESDRAVITGNVINADSTAAIKIFNSNNCLVEK